MSAFSRRRMPDRTAPRSLPRGATLAAIAAALVLASLALTAAASRAQPPEQPPAGTTMVVVLTSDGMTWLPVAAVPVPPTACLPGGAP